jgi:hypothetical protein
MSSKLVVSKFNFGKFKISKLVDVDVNANANANTLGIPMTLVVDAYLTISLASPNLSSS